MIQRYVREAVSPQAEAEGYESFEESEDFEVDDDEDVIPLTHLQVEAMDDEELAEHAAHYGVPIVPEKPATSPTTATTTASVEAPQEN